MLAQDVGEGVIDNIIIDPSLHRWWGAFAVASVAVVVLMVGRHVVRSEPVGSATRWGFVVAQVALTVQLLLGIKLLDQGMGIVQLYIHYVGGLIPLGVFLVGGWVARGDTVRSARILLAMLGVGLLSGIMAYSIGLAYVNG